MMRLLSKLSLAASATVVLAGVAGCSGSGKETAKEPEKKLGLNGFIKGDPKDGKFTLDSNHGVYTIDMSASKVERRDQPIPPTSLKDGAFVTVHGTAKGDTLKANTIRLVNEKGEAVRAPVAAQAPGG